MRDRAYVDPRPPPTGDGPRRLLRATLEFLTVEALQYTTINAPMTSPSALPVCGDRTASEQFDAFVNDAAFPCVGARSALNKDRLWHGQYGRFGDPAGVRALREDLRRFSATFPEPGPQPVSFVALFDQAIATEAAFERHLWTQLQLLADLDRGECGWDQSVSDDPASQNFSMSIAGRAYFVVGMHPQSSRLARRAPMPSLVFNFHNQFELLKATGKYGPMQSAIRKRDVALQGSVNPVLTRFGEASEARQYAGRDVPADWVCPFARSRHV